MLGYKKNIVFKGNKCREKLSAYYFFLLGPGNLMQEELARRFTDKKMEAIALTFVFFLVGSASGTSMIELKMDY